MRSVGEGMLGAHGIVNDPLDWDENAERGGHCRVCVSRRDGEGDNGEVVMVGGLRCGLRRVSRQGYCRSELGMGKGTARPAKPRPEPDFCVG